tara:strand:- start:4381 stop:5430 length:1050 start_codon:yes stop_codon:yes gene_type:complete
MKKVILFSLIILFSIKTQNVFANINVFTVDNIEIIGETNVQNYRNKYLKVAFKKGFQKLITSIIKKENERELLSTDFKTIQSLISSYRILDEKVLENKYNLKVSITFDKNLVSRFLLNQNISYSEVKKLDMVLYPILIKSSEFQVLSKNKFFNEWNENKIFENITFVLPVENLDDIDFIKTNLPVLEEVDLSRLVDNYEIRNSTILILRYDQKKLNVFLKAKFENSKKVSKVDFKLENLENKEARQDIIKNLKFYINELWKDENLIDISIPSYLSINTKMKNSNSLKKIIGKIEEISLIESYTIEQLNNKSAKIKIKFFGKIKNLQNSFRDNGFEFEILHDEWNLNLSS